MATNSGETPYEKWTTTNASPGLRNHSGLDLERKISPSGRGGAFFLTSLFIELIDVVHTEVMNPNAGKPDATKVHESCKDQRAARRIAPPT
jgi:hypothetical protein